MKWHLFLYYCVYCKTHNLNGKTYKEFFEDRELVSLVALHYFQTIRN